MPPDSTELSPQTVRRLEAAQGAFASAIAARMDSDLPWYAALPADERSWVGLVAQAGFGDFLRWLSGPDPDVLAGTALFGTAPRELMRSVTLQQTVELVRAAITVVEEGLDAVVGESHPAEQVIAREALLRYSREVAFAAAAVYARAAEARGAWDARLEALLVDAVLRGDGEDTIASRAAALGWTLDAATTVVIGPSSEETTAGAVARVRSVARQAGGEALVGVQGDRLVVVLSGGLDVQATAEQLARSEFGPGPVVVGPTVPRLPVAARSARAALAGVVAARAWPEAPRPVLADDLLPERALSGDATARRALVDRAYVPLEEAGGALLETLTAYLAHGGSLEACARSLYVHANTVRYRLRRVAEVCGWTPSAPRERFVLQTALALGRLSQSGPGGRGEGQTPAR
ncbi:sugar diacid utilization regulator [Kineococcus radiotolerans]|uniref:Sugar diacid utilization regulator n=1 Tax=Kineococcus radiotolerans TaxID=131568 RepID=A0A7W4TMH5_KINRA|nr:helix-turn-helix domain-containing protein [Kineococcus radiotolerans]MBB2901649.1 sugar diacid utilization regulator [Kineococcus radiotolerans]